MMSHGLGNQALVLVAQSIGFSLDAIVGRGIGPEGVKLTLDRPPFSQHGFGELLVWHELPRSWFSPGTPGHI